jgi:TonB family protein
MPGPGGGGVPYANFKDAIRKKYTDAWLVPDGVTDDSAVATASVTIARDGKVLDARIIIPSGNALADQSVEAALRRVTFAVPLPEGAKEDQRTVKIKFSVKAKLLG